MNNTLIAVSFSVLLIAIIITALWFFGFFTPSKDCEASVWGPCDPITGIRKRTIINQKQGNGKDCGSLEEICPNSVLPFVATGSSSTEPQEYWTIHYLDRHPQICQGSPINGFKLDRLVDSTVRLISNCASNLDSLEKTSKNSEIIGGKTLPDLAVAPIQCGPNEVISNYGLKSEPDGYKFKYDCIKSAQTLECTELSTKPSSDITTHNVKCGANEVLSSIKVKDNGDGVINYIYNCCKKVLPTNV